MHFAVGEVGSATATKGVSWCATILLPGTVLKVVLTWSWHSLLYVLIDRVAFGVHANLGSLRNPRRDSVLASARDLFLSLQDHTWTVLRSNLPTSCL